MVRIKVKTGNVKQVDSKSGSGKAWENDLVEGKFLTKEDALLAFRLENAKKDTKGWLDSMGEVKEAYERVSVCPGCGRPLSDIHERSCVKFIRILRKKAVRLWEKNNKEKVLYEN